MPLSYYCCTHCGFWQRYFAPPPDCPDCLDYRHPLPPNGWRFRTPEEVAARTATRWAEVRPGVFHFWNEPAIGISSQGYLIVRPEGGVAFDAPTWFSDDALRFIEGLGGVRVVAASHQHVYGGLWQLAERFAPDVVVHEADLPMAQALGVTWPFDDHVEVVPGVRLHHTGGHTPGHTVLHLPEERVLFCGDALKFKLNDEGRAVAASTHRAYDARIPITHADARRYHALFERLDFDAVLTPWEHVPSDGKAAALALYTALLEGRPSADWFSFADLGLRPPAPVPAPDPLPRYQAFAEGGAGTFSFPLTDLDRTGIPVWNVARWHPDGYFNSGNSYGVTEREAQVGAWGELAEGLATTRALPRMERRRGSYRALQEAGVPVLDPFRLRLPVGAAYDPEAERSWVEGRRYPSGAPTWVPVEAVATYFNDLRPEERAEALFTPITNGMGAGDTLERALAHGLLELVQRDGNSVRYRALDRGIIIDLDEVHDPSIHDLLNRYHELGIEVQVKLADVTLGMVSLFVVGRERDVADVPHPLMLTSCGEAAHPDREVALRKALLEFAGSRARKHFTHGTFGAIGPAVPEAYVEAVRENPAPVEEQRSLEAMRHWLGLGTDGLLDLVGDTLFRAHTHVALSELPSVEPGSLQGPADVLGAVLERLEREGLELYYVDLTPEGGAVRAAKAIVPELEVETMTYHRIGARNVRRLVEDGRDFVGLGPAHEVEGAVPIPLSPANEARLGGPAWFHPGRVHALMDAWYALYREPSEHVIALLEEGATPAPVRG